MVSAAACSKRVEPVHRETNAVYYWKTVFDLDREDLEFIRRHEVGRVYLRMFDVAEDALASAVAERTFPNASLRIGPEGSFILADSLADREFVPVVYITLEALKAMNGNEGVLARNIVTRVRNMCEYHSIPNVGELQIDCDWTRSTQGSFFALCDSVKGVTAQLELPWRLSATIRLHQLGGDAPPVDCGVLMVYNTGSFDDPDATNSILDLKDVKPYLKHLAHYPLHLDVAYPTYSWQLLFRKRQFVGLLNGLNLADTTQFARRGTNQYVALRDIGYNDRLILKGDVVRGEESAFGDIAKVKEAIEGRLSGREHSNILYHLDSKNLSKYSADEINKIYSTAR